MRKKKIFFITFGLTVALGVVVSGYVKLAMFPRQWEAELFFVYKRKSLDAFVDELVKHEKIQRASIYQGSVWANRGELLKPEELDSVFEITGELAASFRNLLKELGGRLHWKIDDGVLVHLTSASKFEKNFELAFIWRKNGSNERECKISQLEEELGECEITLSEKWSLNYTWHPQI